MTRGPRDRLLGWLRLAAVAALASAAALAVHACGGDGDNDGDDRRPAAEATQTSTEAGRERDRLPKAHPGTAVREFLTAYAEENGERVCELMTRALRKRTERRDSCISRRIEMPPARAQRLVDVERDDEKARVLTVTKQRVQTEFGLVLDDDKWLVGTVRRRGRVEEGEEPSLS